MFFIVGSIWIIFIALIFSNLSILTIGMAGLLLVYITLRTYDKKGILRGVSSLAISLGFLSVVLIYIGLQAKYGQPYYIGGSDDLQFETVASKLISEGVFFPEQMSIRYSGHNSKGFVCFLASFMRLCNAVGGYHTITFRIFNVEMLVLLATLVYRFGCLRSNNTRVAKKAFIFMAFFPNCIYLSSFVFRDTVNMLMLFGLVLVWYEFTRKHNIVKTLLLTSVIGYCLFWFRSQNIIILIALIVCIVIIGQYELSTWKRILIAAAFAAILIVLAPMTDLINSILDISKHYTSNYLSYSGNGFSQIVFSLPLLPFGFFVRMAYAIISPIPTGIIQILTVFDVDSIANFFISCGTIYQIYQLPHLVRGTKKLNDTAMCFLMVWFVVASTTFTFRHFIMMYPFMGYIIAEQKEENKKNYKFFITVGILFLGAIYVVLSL